MRRGLLTPIATGVLNLVTKAQATADNARQMVLNDRPRLKNVEEVAATVDQALASSALEHEELHRLIRDISLTPGPSGPAGKDGRNGADSTTAGPAGRDGRDGKSGADSVVPGPAGKDGRDGRDGLNATQIEYRDGIAVPAMLSLLGSAATTDVTVTWPTPFADVNYLPTVQVTPLDASLIGRTAAAVKSKTATGIVVTVTTTAVLAAGKCVLSAVAYRKA